MKRQPDNLDTIDDSGGYNAREIRGRKIDPEMVEIIARAVQKIQPQVTYSEGNHGLLKWVLGLVSALFVTFITGSVIGYGTLQAVRATQDAQQRQLDGQQHEIERLLNIFEGRSGVARGVPDEPHAR